MGGAGSTGLFAKKISLNCNLTGIQPDFTFAEATLCRPLNRGRDVKMTSRVDQNTDLGTPPSKPRSTGFRRPESSVKATLAGKCKMASQILLNGHF